VIIKWAGGKRWLYKYIHNLLPKNFHNYIEPFFGGGAFMYTFEKSLKGYVSDINPHLIKCHSEIKDNPKRLFENVSKLLSTHSDEQYYKIRSTFNKLNQPEHFLYLNRTCFNGIYRENKKGEFNVPVGRRNKNSFFPYSLEDISILSQKLKKINLQHCDFRETLEKAQKNDFIFIDPPYLDRKIDGKDVSTFRQYNSNEFNENDLEELSEILNLLSKQGAHILISNYSVPKVKEFFPATKGWKYIYFDRASFLSGKSEGRQKSSEVIIHNF
jgi:DNA adenine methylase